MLLHLRCTTNGEYMAILSKDIKAKGLGSDASVLVREKRSNPGSAIAANVECTRITEALEKELLSKKDGPRLLKIKELSADEKFSKIINEIATHYEDEAVGNGIARFFMLAMLNTEPDYEKAAHFASILLDMPKYVALSVSKLISDESYVWHNAIFRDMRILDNPSALAALSNAGYTSSNDPEGIPYWFYRIAMYMPKNSMLHLDALNALANSGSEPHRVKAAIKSMSEIAEDIYYTDSDPNLLQQVLITILSSKQAGVEAIAVELSKISKQLFSNEADGYYASYRFNSFADICASIRDNPQALASNHYLHTVDYTSRIELLLGESKTADSPAKDAA